MKKIIYIIAVLMGLLTLSDCNGRMKYCGQVQFCQLPAEFRDKMLMVWQKTESIYYDSTGILNASTIINLTKEPYFARSIEYGLWVTHKEIRDKNGKVLYKFPREVPYPFIITDEYLYYPEEYNMQPSNINDSTVFFQFKRR
ncbi:MAG: hypothetical protein LIP09_04030 [Bacteroidales bacterium]|nr:hypothetical protein [Bacteroidales bacterium]